MKYNGDSHYTIVKKEDVDRFIEHLKTGNYSTVTVRKYSRIVRTILQALPADGRLSRNAFETRIPSLLEKYSESSTSSIISAYNGFVRFLDRADLCVSQLPADLKTESEQPRLTRLEYNKMVRTAKRLGEEQIWLLIKVLGNLDLKLKNLQYLTAEAVFEGPEIFFVDGKNVEKITLPELLRNDIIGYLRSNDITSGPVFRTKRGKPLDRSRIYSEIEAIGEKTGIDKEKASPRALHRLYHETMREVRERFEPIIMQSYSAILESEKL